MKEFEEDVTNLLKANPQESFHGRQLPQAVRRNRSTGGSFLKQSAGIVPEVLPPPGETSNRAEEAPGKNG